MRDWISSAVIYQVNLRALAAREPRNAFEAAAEAPPDLSPLAYVGRHLERIADLGASVLYLMPPYPVGIENRKGIGSPYAIRDFHSVDPEYGTIEDLAGLVQRAHELEMKVILDITPNHTSRDHVWTRTHPRYHVRRDDGSLFYDWDWSDTAKLNYLDPALRRAMLEVYDSWLKLPGSGGVDGFRLDMAHFINDRGFWNEAVPELRRRHAERQLLFLAESYGTANNLDLFARGINAAYDDDLYKVWVYLYALDPSLRSRVLLSPDAERNADFADKLTAFRAGGIAGAVEKALRVYEDVLPAGEGPWLARYTDNHDEGRGVYRFGADAVRAVMELVFLSPRALPFLLTGQEFGALNRPPIHERIGVCDKGPRMAADGGVRSDPGIEFEGNLFARGIEARRAWHEFYAGLIRLRRETTELTRGSFAVLDVGEDCAPSERAVVAFERRLGDAAVRCAVNLGPEPRRLSRCDVLDGEPLRGDGGAREIPPFSAVVTRPRR
jgi:glycosidase